MELDLVYIAIVIGTVLVSMTLHEAMHAFMSFWLGDDTAKLQGRLTLNPIKHLDPFLSILLPVMLAIVGGPIFGGAKPVPFNPERVRYGNWGSALVAIAGPLTNLMIAFVVFGVYVVIGANPATGVGQVLSVAVMVNLGFFIFNMIPLPPLDGSRVLYALAPEFIQRGMEAIERFGILVIFAVVIFANRGLGAFIIGAITFFLDLFSRIYSL